MSAYSIANGLPFRYTATYDIIVVAALVLVKCNNSTSCLLN